MRINFLFFRTCFLVISYSSTIKVIQSTTVCEGKKKGIMLFSLLPVLREKNEIENDVFESLSRQK